MVDKRREKALKKYKDKVVKSIVIYGDLVDGTTGNSKIIYDLAKMFMSAGHKVYTIGSEYNGVSRYYEDIPVIPSHFCEICGQQNIGDMNNVRKLASYITSLQADFFICVGDNYKFQKYGLGNLGFNTIKTKAIMYGALDSYGIFNNRGMTNSGKINYVDICDKVVFYGDHGVKTWKEWTDKDAELIYPPINLDIYKPISKNQKIELRKKFRFKEDDFIIYYSGRNSLRKRHETLIDAACKFICETKDTYLYLNIPPLGWYETGEPIYADTLNPWDFIKRVMKHKYGRDLFEEGRILLVKRNELGDITLNEQKNSEFYKISDLYVTTTGGEGLGLTPIESLACGVPAIVSDNTTGSEVLGLLKSVGEINLKSKYRIAIGGLLLDCPNEGYVDYGLMQKTTTPEITYEAIRYMYDNPKRREEFGKNGRSHVEETFNKEQFSEKWLNLINTTEKKKQEKAEFKEMKIEGDKK